MTPEERALMHRRMHEIMGRAVNRPDATNLAAQLADKTTRALATPSRDDLEQIGIRTVNALVPFIQELQAAVSALSERLDALEGRL